MILSEKNNELCAFGARWRLDGDYLRCLGCARAEGKRPSPNVCQVGRPMIASCDGQPFKHVDGCKNADSLHPWAELRSLIAEPSPAIEPPKSKPRRAKQKNVAQSLEIVQHDSALLNINTVMKLFGLSRATIYRQITLGNLAEPIRLSARCIRFRAVDVREFAEKTRTPE